jgi:hypothetical protein
MMRLPLRSRRDDRANHRRLQRRRRFAVEALEGRQMLSTFSVTNNNDSGAGSLRQAILSSNGVKGPNAISFNIPGTGVHTIEVLSALPTITQPLTLDGTTEPGSGGQAVIQIDGTKAGSTAVGLDLNSAASGSTIKGLAVTAFSSGGVLLNDASNVTLSVDEVGVVQKSALVVVSGNSPFGVELENGANHDILTDDVISGQNGNGVVITGSGTTNNVVQGSFIGTNPSGSQADPNGNGVVIEAGAASNTIGGTTSAARDVISGNLSLGVEITGIGTSKNIVEGAYIGTNAAGTGALPNGINGVDITYGATNNTVGGTAAGARNVISGNTFEGVAIAFGGTSGNVVEGDYIGTDYTGANRLANGDSGVTITGGATNNTVGGTTVGARNVISGNVSYGVGIGGTGTEGNVVEGDYVGTDVTGARSLANGQYGVQIYDGACNNTVGGTTVGARNVISGNVSFGVSIDGIGAEGNVVEGNYIGTDATGTISVGNDSGVEIWDGASSNTIGGSTPFTRNVISGNISLGIYIVGSGTNSNMVEGNYIGTDFSGTEALGNGQDGARIDAGASYNVIGGSSFNDQNVIEFNQQNGVSIVGPSVGNVIQYDIISLNAWNGVIFVDASSNSVDGCMIEANGYYGITANVGGNEYVNNTLVNNLSGNFGTY